MSDTTIVKQHRRTNFTVVSNDLLNDRTLSWQETGLMCYLLSLPDGWAIRTDDLMNRKTNGRDAVRNLQASLAKKGYLQIDTYQDERSRWRRTVHVFETPLDNPVTGSPALETRHGESGTENPARKPRRHSKDSEAKTQRAKTKSKEPTTTAAVVVNSYTGVCASCDGVVEAGAGRLVGKKPAHLVGECPAATSKYPIANHQDEAGWV